MDFSSQGVAWKNLEQKQEMGVKYLINKKGNRVCSYLPFSSSDRVRILGSNDALSVN